MKLKTPKPNPNFWIIGGTLAFFILSYFFYLKSYVPNQESKIISTRFRVLDQLGDNINAKIESYTYNVLSLENKIQDTVNSLKDQFEFYGISVPKEQIVPFILKGFIQGEYQEFLNKDLQVIDYKLDYGESSNAKNISSPQGNELDRTETDRFFYFKPLAIMTESAVYEDVETYHDSVLVRVKYESIMNGLIRDDVFDELFIIRNKEFIFSTLKSDMLVDKSAGNEDIFELLFTYAEPPKPAEGKAASQPERKLSIQKRMISGEYSDLTISNKDYKLFFKPIKVEGEYWFIGGLIELGHFNATGQSIPQRVIIILSMILILIILGLPLIKLKVISNTEQLKAGTIVNSAVAILLGASILTMFLLYYSQNKLRLQNADIRLKNLSAAIDSTFTGEITDAFNQLEEMDSLYDSYQFGLDAIRKNKNIIENILNLNDENPAKAKIYPFSDYIFWANMNGVQSAYLTPFKNMTGEMVDVKQRDYYNKKSEWFFPPEPAKKFRLESILSIRNGDHKVAISTSSQTNNNPVVAITSKFYSLIDPIIPKNFGFCIIDEKGEVWFHSDEDRNLMENFIRECNDNKTLISAIYSRTSTSVDVTYYNTAHRAFIKPLNQLPLYLITLYSLDTETSFHSEVFTIALIFIGLFFMFITLQIAVLLILERLYQGKLTKNMIVAITRPMAHLKDHYWFLIRVYLIVTIVTAIGLQFAGKIHSFAAIYFLEVIIFSFSYRVLNDNAAKQIQSKWFTRINYTLLILMNILLFIYTDKVTVFIILGCQLLLIILLNKAYLSFKRKLKDPESPTHQFFVRNYLLFLLSSSIIFSILPTMVFYEIAFNKESEIRLRHYQVDLMKKREVRNTKWNKYYAPMIESPESTAILQDRKNRGIYTDFLNGLTFSKSSIPNTENEDNIIQGNIFDSFFLSIRPYYDDEIIEDKFLISENQNNRHNYWMNNSENDLVFKYLSNTEDPKFKTQEYMMITGKEGKFNFLLPYPLKAFTGLNGFMINLVFWLIMLFFFFIIYRLIRFGARNIYSLDIMADYAHEPFGQLIRHQMLVTQSTFLVKLSSKDETDAFADIIQIDLRLNWSDKEVITNSEGEIDTIISDEAKKNDFVTIYIDHFEWGFTNPEIMQQKLEIILKFFRNKDIHWLIQSYENPAKFISYYQEIIDFNKSIPQDDNNTVRIDMALYKKILSDLQKLMSNSIINPLPVKFIYTKEGEEDPCGKPVKESSLEELIEEELNACDYLGRFKETLYEYYNSNIKGKNLENPEELIIGKINTLADGYYEELFNSCTPIEQYVILDLSGDLMMNQKNSIAIFGLLQKGIFIKKCDRITFMNVSFRRFILSYQTKLDISELDTRIGKKAGTWQGYRIMFIVIIVSLFIFISMANQDLIKNLQQIFVVIGGGIASITGILGLLSRNTKSASK